MSENNNDTKQQQRTISIGSIWATLEQAQSNHGIPHQDYQQYHSYCTARLARLRRVEPVRNVLLHNPKYVDSSTTTVRGKGRHAYAARDVETFVNATEHGSHENVVWDILVQAERAWAQAHALQQQRKSSGGISNSSNSNNTQQRTNHHHVQRRLNKASKLAAQAVQLFCNKSSENDILVEEQTQQELRSYAAWCKGNAALEKRDHLQAFRSYQEARQILRQLVQQQQSESDRERLALMDIWTTRAESVLKPLVRYCQYEARDELKESDYVVLDDDAEDGAVIQKNGPSSSIVLSFRGQDIAVDDYPELVVLYLKLEDLLKAAPSTLENEKLFLQLLSDLDDALKWAQTEYCKYESLAAGPAVNAKRQELQNIMGYFQYQKLSIWRQQQEKRVTIELAQKGGADDVGMLHLYDTLQQNAQAMADLPAAAVDNANVQDDPYWLEAQAHVVRFRAFRCYYLARLYESPHSGLHGTPQQVLALLKQATKLAKRAQEEVAACDDIMGEEEANEHLQSLDDLITKIKAMTCRLEAARYVQQKSSGTSLRTDRPLWLRLEDSDAGTVLADDPPLFIPIPSKPTFFDIAWQHIGGDDLSGVSTVLDEYLANHPEPKTSGGGGLFGRLGGGK